MCISYRSTSPQILQEAFGAHVDPQLEWRDEVWQDYPAPIIRADDNKRVTHVASYGFIPKLHLKGPRLTTMNARIEEIGSKRNYKEFWRTGQLCLVPCEHFYEPNWETGKHIRYRIGMADGSPFAVAGMWRTWKEEDGSVTESFTQLTMNADDHPVMKHFHRPGEEKRSLIIIPRDDWDDWLLCRDPETARSFARPFPPELMATAPAPLPPRKKKEETSTPPGLF